MQVVSPSSGEAVELPFTDYGIACNSANSESGLDVNGLGTDEAKAKANAWVESTGCGNKKVNYNPLLESTSVVVIPSLRMPRRPFRN